MINWLLVVKVVKSVETVKKKKKFFSHKQTQHTKLCMVMQTNTAELNE